jgi:predicted nucleic acid-binding Zn finger protein
MNSSMIGKIEKAHRYAREPERIRFQTFDAVFRGEHDEYTVRLVDGAWTCSCHTFASHSVGTCSHVMAMQQILSTMLSDGARFGAQEAVPAAV